MNWDDCRDAFHLDGSLRDIYVLKTSESDWDEFLSYIRSRGFSCRYTRDNVEADLPHRVADPLSDQTCAHLLAIDIGDIVLNCHFFTVEDIEVDLEPNAVTSQAELEIVLNFMRDVGIHLSKDVVLTEENNPQFVLLQYLWKNKAFKSYLGGSAP